MRYANAEDERMKSIKLYSFSAAIFMLPLMDFSFSQIPSYLKGLEFRTLLAELVAQVTAGIADAAIVAVIQTALGVA
jgi:hypothetical protein